MKRSEPVELMNMCVLRRGSKVLVQDRTDPNWPGVAFPGGHVEKGESFTDSVIREVQEETGLTISSPRLCGIKDWCEDGVRHVVLLYRAEQFTGMLRSSDGSDMMRMRIVSRSALPTRARSGGRSSPVSPRSILHLPTCSTFSACLKKMISASCSTARTVKIGLTN